MAKTIVMQSTIDHLIASKQPNVLSKLMSGEWDKRELDSEDKVLCRDMICRVCKQNMMEVGNSGYEYYKCAPCNEVAFKIDKPTDTNGKQNK